jgi:hypothetical protein
MFKGYISARAGVLAELGHSRLGGGKLNSGHNSVLRAQYARPSQIIDFSQNQIFGDLGTVASVGAYLHKPLKLSMNLWRQPGLYLLIRIRIFWATGHSTRYTTYLCQLNR